MAVFFERDLSHFRQAVISALIRVTEGLTIEHFNFHSVNTFLFSLNPLTIIDFLALQLATLKMRRKDFESSEALMLLIVKLLSILLSKLPSLAFEMHDGIETSELTGLGTRSIHVHQQHIELIVGRSSKQDLVNQFGRLLIIVRPFCFSQGLYGTLTDIMFENYQPQGQSARTRRFKLVETNFFFTKLFIELLIDAISSLSLLVGAIAD